MIATLSAAVQPYHCCAGVRAVAYMETYKSQGRYEIKMALKHVRTPTHTPVSRDGSGRTEINTNSFHDMCKGRYQPWFHQQEIRSRDGENIITPSMGHLSSHQMVDHTQVNSQHLGLINSV